MQTKRGDKIFVHVEGTGQDVILLHSWCGSHRDWTKLIPELSKRYRLFAWDARGHALSPLEHPEDCTLANMADDLAQMIEHYEITTPTIIAHSMGAFVLWQYLETYGPKKLSKICILDQTPKLVTDETWGLGIYGNFDQTKSDDFIARLSDDFAQNVIELAAHGKNQIMRKKFDSNDASINGLRTHLQKLPPQPLIEIWKNLTKVDFRDLLSQIDLPTLLVYGDESNYYGSETAQYMHKAIKNSHLHIYEGADHSPHLRQAKRFIHDFLTFSAGDTT